MIGEVFKIANSMREMPNFGDSEQIQNNLASAAYLWSKYSTALCARTKNFWSSSSFLLHR